MSRKSRTAGDRGWAARRPLEPSDEPEIARTSPDLTDRPHRLSPPYWSHTRTMAGKSTFYCSATLIFFISSGSFVIPGCLVKYAFSLLSWFTGLLGQSGHSSI